MGGFELQNPRGLYLLAGVVPIVLFYILKIQRQRQRSRRRGCVGCAADSSPSSRSVASSRRCR